MDIKKIKESCKIYDKTFSYMQKIKALLIILNSDEAPYPSNFLLTIAKRNLKSGGAKVSRCHEILTKIAYNKKS